MASASEGQSAASAEEQEATAKQKERDTSTGQEDTQGSGEDSPDSGDQEAQGSGDQEAQGSGDQEDQDSDEEDEGAASGQSMARAIDDVSSLPGETINDQDGRKIGEVKEVYAVGDDETPMWVTIESATGLGRKRAVFVPLARIKRQGDELRIPYSFDHVHDSPEVEPEDEISEEDDRALRVYYAIGLADQELVGSARSYASQVAEEDGPARKIDADSAEGPARELDDTPPAKRVAEAYEKQKEEEGEEHGKPRETTAEEIFQEDEDESEGSKDEDSKSEASRDEDRKDEDPKSEEKSAEED